MASTPRHHERAWYLDAVSAFAFFALCLLLSKGASRLFGPFGGLFFFLITGGAGWYFAKSAWRGLLGDRQG
jgi:hypothetical protein